jgi:hypothetical protein
MPGSRCSPLYLRHIRHPRRVIPQLSSMRNKHPAAAIDHGSHLTGPQPNRARNPLTRQAHAGDAGRTQRPGSRPRPTTYNPRRRGGSRRPGATGGQDRLHHCPRSEQGCCADWKCRTSPPRHGSAAERKTGCPSRCGSGSWMRSTEASRSGQRFRDLDLTPIRFGALPKPTRRGRPASMLIDGNPPGGPPPRHHARVRPPWTALRTRRSRCPELAIMRHGRWKSASVMRGYIHERIMWSDNAGPSRYTLYWATGGDTLHTAPLRELR